jgi:calcium permeable stress-gated cation channel
VLTPGLQIASEAVLASVGTSVAITLLIAGLFCILRPYNTVVYAPRLRHADEKHAPPPLGKGIFAWFNPVITIKEQQLCEKVGLDATVFIRFAKMCRNIFLVLSVVGCGILIPVNVVTGNLQTGAAKGVSGFMKMTPQYMYGQIFWAMVACAWVIDIVVCFFLWTNYRGVTRLRRAYLESPEYQSSLHSRTLMVTEIPKNLRTDEGVVRIVDQVKNMQDFPRGSISRNVKELPDLIEEHEETVKELEAVLSKFLKNGTVPEKRPMCKASKKDAAYAKGQKVDAIDYLTERIKTLEAKITEVRESVDQRNAMSYGFASYESLEEAHTVAYAGRSKHPQGAVVKLAPRPSDIIWKNLPLTPRERRNRGVWNNLWIGLLTLVWIAPNALIAVFLANLSNLGKVWPAFNTQMQKNPKTWAVVQGVLAPALTSLFYLVLPTIFRRLRIQAGDVTKTSRERHVLAKLYAFFTLNNLIMFSLFGALWQFVATVISHRRDGEDVPAALTDGDFFNKTMIALCQVSPFWISWLLQRNLGAAVDLSQLVNLGWGSFARRFLSPTPRQLIEWTAPPPFDYANYYNYFLFYATVALAFSTLQPLVLPVTALYFVLDSYLKKYLVLYVFVTKTESGGQFWRVVFNRFLFAIFLSNVVIAVLIKAKGITWIPMLATMAPLPFLLAAFKWYCAKTFDDQIHFYTKGVMNTEATLDDSKSRRSNNVAIRFGHPALFKPLMTPMVNAKSQHLLAQVYRGRLDDDLDDTASTAGFSDAYSLSNMKPGGKLGKKKDKKKKKGLFEFVSETAMDFANFKNRADFRSDHGGDGELFGKPEDIARGATPANGPHSRSESRDSERTMISSRDGSPASAARAPLPGTTYPAGYHQTPSSGLRGYSPSPDRGQGWSSERNLIAGAAPMARTASPAPSAYRDVRTPSSAEPTPDEQAASFDYFRGRSSGR